MAKKLVFDRTLWINLGEKTATVPNGEVWKVAGFTSSGPMESIHFEQVSGIVVGAGTKIQCSRVTGIAFKIVEE